MLTTKEVRERITEENEFDCTSPFNVICARSNDRCPFDLGEDGCGGHSYYFDWEAMKHGKERTLKGLLKYKAKGNKNTYPNLK